MKRRICAAVVVLSLLTAGFGGSAVGAAQSDGVDQYFGGVGVEEYNVNPGGQLGFRMILNAPTEGVGEFEYDFALSDPDKGEIVGVEPGPGVSDFQAVRGPANDTLTVNGTGASRSDDSFVGDHVVVAVRGDETGRFQLVPESVRLTDGNGEEYEVNTRPQTVRVTERPIVVASVRQGHRGAYNHSMQGDGSGEAELTIVGQDVDTGVGAIEVNLTRDSHGDGVDTRFVDAAVHGDPDQQSITFGPNGTTVNVTASGMDTADSGVVPLVNVTVRALEPGEIHVEYGTYALTDERGVEYVVDHHTIGAVEFSAASEKGPPTFTPPTTDAGTASDVESTNATDQTDDGTPGAGTTAGTGPGFGALATLLAVVIASATSLVRRRLRGA